VPSRPRPHRWSSSTDFMYVCADFKRGTKFEVSQLSNVDLYQLMCHVMQLEAAPHNGTWANVCDALLDDDTCSEGPYKRDDHSKSD